MSFLHLHQLLSATSCFHMKDPPCLEKVWKCKERHLGAWVFRCMKKLNMWRADKWTGSPNRKSDVSRNVDFSSSITKRKSFDAVYSWEIFSLSYLFHAKRELWAKSLSPLTADCLHVIYKNTFFSPFNTQSPV